MVKVFSLTLIILFFTSPAFAKKSRTKNSKDKIEILTNTEIAKKLTPRYQTKYLLKRAELILAVETYQNLKLKRNIGKRKSAFLLEVFHSKAFAIAEIGDFCSMAGYSSRLRKRRVKRANPGLTCDYPGPKCDNGKGYQCNPDVFANDINGFPHCVPKTNSTGVTRTCLQRSVSTVFKYKEIASANFDREKNDTFLRKVLGPKFKNDDASLSNLKKGQQKLVSDILDDCKRKIAKNTKGFKADQCSDDIRNGKVKNSYYKSQSCNCSDIDSARAALNKLERVGKPVAEPEDSDQDIDPTNPLACIQQGFVDAGEDVSEPYLQLIAASVQTYGSKNDNNTRTKDPQGNSVFKGAFRLERGNTRTNGSCRDQLSRQSFLRGIIENIDSKGWCSSEIWPEIDTPNPEDKEWLNQVIHGERKVWHKKYEAEGDISGAERFNRIFNVDIHNRHYKNAFTGIIKGGKTQFGDISQSQRRSLWRGFILKKKIKKSASGKARQCIDEAQKSQGKKKKYGGRRKRTKEICLALAKSCGQTEALCSKKYDRPHRDLKKDRDNLKAQCRDNQSVPQQNKTNLQPIAQ